MHTYELSVQKGLDQGTLLLGASTSKLAEVPANPEGVEAMDWVRWHCFKEVQEWMIDNKKPSAMAACRETGWSYEFYRACRKNAYALGMWADLMGSALEATGDYLRGHLMEIAEAMVHRAKDRRDPQGVQAARLVLQEIKQIQEKLEEHQEPEGPAISSSALLAMGKPKKVTARRRRRRGKTVIEEEVEVDVELEEGVT